MVTVVIFWAAVFAIIFFLLGVVCKGLAAMFNGAIESLTSTGALAFLAILAIMVLYILYEVIHGIINDGLGEVLGTVILLFVVISIIGGLIAGLGSLIVSIVVSITRGILFITSFVLEGAASLCETAYGYFLNIIVEKLEQC